jgi:hypothetical protein
MSNDAMGLAVTVFNIALVALAGGFLVCDARARAKLKPPSLPLAVALRSPRRALPTTEEIERFQRT